MNEKAIEAAHDAAKAAARSIGLNVDTMTDGEITGSEIAVIIRAAIAAYEKAMWRPKINWEDPEDPIVKLLVQYPVDEFVAEYEYGEYGYEPDTTERALIEDAIYGFITDLHEKMRAALPLPPKPEGE